MKQDGYHLAIMFVCYPKPVLTKLFSLQKRRPSLPISQPCRRLTRQIIFLNLPKFANVHYLLFDNPVHSRSYSIFTFHGYKFLYQTAINYHKLMMVTRIIAKKALLARKATFLTFIIDQPIPLIFTIANFPHQWHHSGLIDPISLFTIKTFTIKTFGCAIGFCPLQRT